MYRYFFGIAIIGVAFLKFLVKPNMGRLSRVFSGTLALSLSYVIPVIYSMFLWIFNTVSIKFMTKGFFYTAYIVIALLTSASSLYMFGRKSILYTTVAMGIANTLIMIPVALGGGVGTFFKEFIDLVITFGDTTGELMRKVEVHDLTFAFGLVLLFAIIEKDLIGRLYIFPIALFFVLLGLKRISVAGIILSAVIFFVLCRLKGETCKKIMYISSGIIVFVTFSYILAIRSGLFTYLEEIGLDTKGRDIIYGYLNGIFEISPLFMGKGLGFSNEPWDLPIYSKLVQDAYHNEFLRMYIELGFIGYFIWIFLHLVYRLIYFTNKKVKNGLIFFVLSIYCYITYATDNTYYYFYINFAIFLLSMYGLLELDDEVP